MPKKHDQLGPQELDELVQLDASGDESQADSDIVALKAQLDSLAEAVVEPEPKDFLDDPNCKKAVEAAIALGDTWVGDAGRSSSSPEKILGTIRDYQLLSKVGEGGMGAVYKALHTRLKKVVALKVLPQDKTSNEESLARFEREMEAIGKLHHPNIIGALDAGDEDGQHFLVMELVDGRDLSQILKAFGPLAVADACELVRQAAIGLQEAHEHDMVHRDIKPSNLMLAVKKERRKRRQP